MILPTAGTRRFVYDSAGRVMGEYGASASDVQAEFIWLLPEVGASGTFGGDDGLGGYMPLAVATPDNSSAIQLNWIHADHLGTPILATDALGDPASTPDDYLAAAFPGQSRMFGDLYYNRYRDYDPSTGRYIQGDPIGLEGGANPYLYAGANPVNDIDPMGLCDRAIGRSFETGPLFPLDCASEALEKANRHARGEILCVDPWEVGENLLIGAGLTLIGGDLFKLGKYGLERIANAPIRKGIYEFTATSGRSYVGQSANISRRLRQHIRSGKLHRSELPNVIKTAVPGGRLAREIAEQARINELGGIKNLENVRNPIGPARKHLIPNDPR